MEEVNFYLDRWTTSNDGELNSFNLEQKLKTKYKHRFDRFTMNKGWSIGNHTHEEAKADAILRGKMELVVYPINKDSQTFLLENGDILYLSSGIVHRAKVIEDCIFYDSFK